MGEIGPSGSRKSALDIFSPQCAAPQHHEKSPLQHLHHSFRYSAKMSPIKNIAIVGASGQSGTHILDSLLSTNTFKLTAITRSSSNATFPPSVEVQRGVYDSDAFFESALQGQDVLIVVLAGTAPKDLQSRLIKAAAAARVPWMLPCEFGPDSANPEITKEMAFLASKKVYRDEVEALGESSWIGVVTGFWFDFVSRSYHPRL